MIFILNILNKAFIIVFVKILSFLESTKCLRYWNDSEMWDFSKFENSSRSIRNELSKIVIAGYNSEKLMRKKQ